MNSVISDKSITSKVGFLLQLLAGMLVGSTADAGEIAWLNKAPAIDGVNDEAVWQQLAWRKADHLIVGEQPTALDLSVRYKLGWREEGLYLLAEIKDDILSDSHPDPLVHYWDDDCLEIFVDEDASGGIHTNNFNAFAYHIALDNQVVDIAPVVGEKKHEEKGQPFLANEHITSRWQRSKQNSHSMIWEVKLKLISDQYDSRIALTEQTERIRKLKEGKVIGFMLAYCDNDGGQSRQHFVGSVDIEPVNGDKNRGYIDASTFEKMKLFKTR